MKALYSILNFLIAVIFLSGCSSFVSGYRQSVTVITPDAEGASCTLTDAKGRVWHIEQTPASALVKRGDGPISVICSKTGYNKATAMLEEEIAPANYGNLALGPIAPIGYFLDSMSGSAERYKSSIELSMDPLKEKKPWETSYDYDSGSR